MTVSRKENGVGAWILSLRRKEEVSEPSVGYYESKI